MGFIGKIKKARELGRQLKRVKQEMTEVEVGKHSLKVRVRKTAELVRKLRGVQEKMGEWELGVLSQEADKEGKKLDKLITLAEARERVALAKLHVSQAKARLREPKLKGPKVKRKPTKIVFSGLTIKSLKRKAPLPKRKTPRITPKRPTLRR